MLRQKPDVVVVDVDVEIVPKQSLNKKYKIKACQYNEFAPILNILWDIWSKGPRKRSDNNKYTFFTLFLKTYSNMSASTFSGGVPFGYHAICEKNSVNI